MSAPSFAGSPRYAFTMNKKVAAPAAILSRSIDWCCFHYFVRNSLVAFLEALCARESMAAASGENKRIKAGQRSIN